MGPLQPGLPTPSAIHMHWSLAMDLKDCFFTIPLCEEDKEKTATSVPTLDHKEPVKCYQWLHLTQWVRNSPTVCQSYVDTAIPPTPLLLPEANIIHYMDDILPAAEHHENLTKIYMHLQNQLINADLQIAL
jgi:hypothetical protein